MAIQKTESGPPGPARRAVLLIKLIMQHVYLSIYLSIYLYLSMSLSLSLSIYLYIYIYICTCYHIELINTTHTISVYMLHNSYR